MCGISGFITYNPQGIHLSEEQLRMMSNKMTHRGPDHQGVFCMPHIGLAHNRLSIIDLSDAANQPMSYGPYKIVFNGEVYNFKELRLQLESLGHQFKTHSDTEVVIAAYAQWGTDSFRKLNGIFALAIFNTTNNDFVLVRDRFGIKPLYYTEYQNCLLFASEIKAILATGIIPRSINYKALNEYMYYVNPMGNETIYNNISKVDPGSFIAISNGKPELRKYWDIDYNAVCDDDEDTAVEKIKYLLENAVKRQLVSDVPVSTFLSGGIDSSAVTTFAAKHYSSALHTYSVEFDFNRSGKSELDMAKIIAAQNNTIHQEVLITSQGLGDVVDYLAYQHDEPFADAANIPLYLLTRTLKNDIKVVLQGDGGDELFGGYNYYNLLASSGKYMLPAFLYKQTLGRFNINHPLFARMKRISHAMSEPDLHTRIGLLVTGAMLYNKPLSSLHPSVREACEHLDPFAELRKLPIPKSDPLQLMHWIDMKTILPNDYLEKVDKPTMANSIEVRVPFLDYELTDYVMSLPGKMKVQNGEKKYLLKKALRGTVPDTILDAPKRGFGVPVIQWLQTGLNTKMKDVLTDPLILKSGLFDTKEIDRKIASLDSGDLTHGMDLWRCMNIAMWYKHYMA